LHKNDGKTIFVKYFRHYRTKKIVRAKNGGVIVIHIKQKN